MGKPMNIMVNGEVYKAMVLKVETKDAEGLPRSFTPVYEDETIMVEDGMHFMVVYAKESIIRKSTRQ